jgi:hypothetical protein
MAGFGEAVRQSRYARRRSNAAAISRSVSLVRRCFALIAVVALALVGSASSVGAAPPVSGATTVAGPGTLANNDVAFDGTNFLVVWERTSAGGSDVYGRRLRGDGTVLGSAFPIAATTFDETRPAVAWNGSSYLVVYEFHIDGDTNIDAKHVSAAGVVGADTYAVASGSTQEEAPDVAGAGPNFIVVWQDARNATNGFDIWASGMQGNGGGLGQWLIGGDRYLGADTEPAVAYLGNEDDFVNAQFLVTWQHAFGTTSAVLATRTRLNLRIDDTGPVYVSEVDHSSTAPDVASDGTRYLVVWRRKSTSAYDIRGAVVDNVANHGAGVSFPISTAPGDEGEPAVVFAGQYLVAWTDRRNATRDVFGARVTTSGSVTDAAGFGIASTSADEHTPALSGAPGGKWGVVYQSGSSNAVSLLLRTVAPK